MTQWHPLLAKLLRLVVEDPYRMHANLAVGDAPRQADLVLLQRKPGRRHHFQGVWKHLTTWNVLEYKGPTVSPRRGDLERLVELGLGIQRRLNEDRIRQRKRPVPADEAAYWYLVNRVGRRFLRWAAVELDTRIEPCDPGVWRCRVLRRMIFLVSVVDLPVDRESLPLHVLSRGSEETERAAARLVAQDPTLWDAYGPWVASFHPAAAEEFHNMVRAGRGEFKARLEPLIELMGMEEVIRQIGLGRVIDQVGLDRVIDQVGLDRVIDQVGVDRVIDQVGPKKMIDHLGFDRFLANLTPAQRRELKRRLQ